MTDQARGEDEVIAEFRATSEEMGLTPDEIDEAIAKARASAAESGLPLERALFEASGELSVQMGREG
jgi:phosphosulfolactate synthase (CoM biosynthesis protein A)